MRREEALAVIEALGVAPVFSESYRAKRLPENLEIYFGPPEEYFMAASEWERPCSDPYSEGERLVPLLDDGILGSILFLDQQTKRFVLKYVETPEPAAWVFSNWQQYLAHLVGRMAESGVDDEELARIAEVIGFRHLPATLQHFYEGAGLTPQEVHHRWAAFVSALSP